jgi:glycerol-1-phosphate dehydrogenase [NAD(P)+]
MIDPGLFSIHDYLQQTFQCSCGREHSTSLKEVNISQGALESIPALIKKYNHQKAFFLYDSNTYAAAGKQIREIMNKSKISYTDCILEYTELVPNESILGEIIVQFDHNCDLIIAVGTGTINDICKFLSYQINLEYYIIATAPSMDGFASSGAALIINNMKVTYDVRVPAVIIADINIIKNAPMDMITAGISDILGKYTCLIDWKISNIINDEYYCDIIVEMVQKSIKIIVDNIHLVQSRNPKVIFSIMEGLILSGIAMSFIGNSRPASGSEHHLSHYWEMMFLFQGKKMVLHGTKVGIGTIAVLKSYELLISKSIDFNRARTKIKSFSQKSWEETIKRTFQTAADEVIKLEEKVQKNTSIKVLNRIDLVEHNWDKIIDVVREVLPPTEKIITLLKELQCPVTPIEVGIDNETFLDSMIVAKEVRNRYGLLQLLFDLNLADETAKEVQEYFSKIR